MGKRVAIFLHGQKGDIMEASSVLKYKDELWGEDCEITWFIQDENRDIFKHNPYLKLAHFPHGYGIPESDMNTIYAERIAKDKADGKPEWFDLSQVKTHDNKLDITKKHLYEPIIGVFDVGYYPAPHQVPSENREGLEYSLVSKQVFSVPNDYEWHPVLFWDEEERNAIKSFASTWKQNKKTILLETFAGSGQCVFYSAETTKEIMRVCRDVFNDEVTFIFGSHKHVGGENNIGILNSDLFDRNDRSCISAGYLSIRQTALINDYVDLIIGISSGVSVATSAFGLKPTPKIQWCGSRICSTKAIANGEFHLVEAEFKTKENATKEFFSKLEEVLLTI